MLNCILRAEIVSLGLQCNITFLGCNIKLYLKSCNMLHGMALVLGLQFVTKLKIFISFHLLNIPCHILSHPYCVSVMKTQSESFVLNFAEKKLWHSLRLNIFPLWYSKGGWGILSHQWYDIDNGYWIDGNAMCTDSCRFDG